MGIALAAARKVYVGGKDPFYCLLAPFLAGETWAFLSCKERLDHSLELLGVCLIPLAGKHGLSGGCFFKYLVQLAEVILKMAVFQEMTGIKLCDKVLKLIREEEATVSAQIGCLQIPQGIGSIHEADEEKSLGRDEADLGEDPCGVLDPDHLLAGLLKGKGLDRANLRIFCLRLLLHSFSSPALFRKRTSLISIIIFLSP